MEDNFFAARDPSYQYSQSQTPNRDAESAFLDRLFGNVTQTVNGVNQVVDAFTGDASRRTAPQYSDPYGSTRYSDPYGTPYMRPINVGYGWGDVTTSRYGNQINNGGYPGIFNMNYGMLGGKMR